MKKLIKTITIMLVMFLVTMSVDSIDTSYLRVAFANDDSTGYKIDVNYDENNEANLIGNFENINSEITLTSLVDEDGNIYDPYNFSLHITENKTYDFKLHYKNKEEKELFESIEVIVDKVNKDEDSEDKLETSDVNEASENKPEVSDDENSFTINDTPVYKLKTEIQNDKLSAIIYLDKSSASEMNTIYSITDDKGNTYDLNSDKWIINKNGDYTFEIKYRDNNTGMKMIDKISIKISELEERKSIPVSELKKKMSLQSRATQSDKFELQAYTSESNYKLGKTVEFAGGIFADYKDELDAAVDKRNFKEAKILIGGENGSYYNISALYRYEENGKFEDYYILEGQGSDVQLAYQLSSTDEVRLFYETESNKTYKITNNSSKDWKVEITPNDTDNIRAGSLVIVKFTYPLMYIDANIKVKKSSGEDIEIKELVVNKENRTKTIIFEMPNGDVNFDYNGVNSSSNTRFVGVYNRNSTYFNAQEVGYSSIESSTVEGGKKLIHKIENKIMYSRPETVYPPVGENGIQGGIHNQLPVLDNNTTIRMPVSNYEAGKKLTFTYTVQRGTPDWANLTYEYYAIPSFIVDYFPGESTESNFKSQNYVRTYFRTSKGNGLVGDASAITTTLENGMKITSKVKSRSKADYKLSTTTASLLKTEIEITIEHAYNDFRILTNSISSANSSYSIESVEGLAENSYVEFNNGNPSIFAGLSFNNNERPNKGYFTFHLFSKKGYSVPNYKLYDEKGNDITNNNNNSYRPVTGQFPNSKGEYVLDFYTVDSGHETYRLELVSKLIKYNYNFSGITKTDYGLDIENKRFFTVPNDIPNVTTGEYFNGWQLNIIMNDGSEKTIENSGRDNGLFYGNDLVDILDIYEQSLKYMTTDEVGKDEYTLNFKPVIGTIRDGSLVNIKVSHENQNSFNSYSEFKSTDLKGVYGETVRIGNYHERVEVLGNDYIINKAASTLGGTINKDNFTVGTLKYDKVIKVLYESGTGTTNNPVDDGEYTITNGNSSVVKVSNQTMTNGNATFEGWVIKGDDSGKIYSYNESIELSMLNKNLLKNIFDDGQMVLIAKWKGLYEPVKSDHDLALGDYIDQEKEQIIFENEDFTIEAIFKWENVSGSWDTLKDNLKVALYKQGPNESSFNLLASNESGQGQNNSNVSWKYEDLGNNKIKVSATIKNSNGNSIDKISANNAKYRIIAWNDQNGNFTASDVNDQVGKKVPSVTTTITVLSNIDIIKYPAEIKLFDQTDGSIQSSKQMITLDSQYNSQKWSNEFTISVDKEIVKMSNTGGSSFDAKILKDDGTEISSTNKELGTLNYGNKSKQALIFTIKKDTGIKNANGDIYTGTMKFVVNKKAVNP